MIQIRTCLVCGDQIERSPETGILEHLTDNTDLCVCSDTTKAYIIEQHYNGEQSSIKVTPVPSLFIPWKIDPLKADPE